MKKYILTIFISILVLFCIIYPESMISSTKSALTLWATIIVPSLFPFMILSNLIQQTAVPFILGKTLSPLMNIIFSLPGISSLAIILGMTGGYPIGAKVTSDLLKENSITKQDANHLITFVNNAGPLFMLGAIGIGIYKNIYVGILLLISHYLSALFIGFISKLIKKKDNKNNHNNSQISFNILKLSEIGTVLNETIKKSIDIILSIGGFIILFSIISSLIEKTKILSLIGSIIFPTLEIETSNAISIGLLEVTNGVNKIATINNISLLQKLIITSILLGFGGMSIHFQTLSIISKTDISFLKYILGKTFQGILSGLITYLLTTYTKFSQLIPLKAFNSFSNNSIEFLQILNTMLAFFMFIVLFKLLQIILHTKH